MFDELASFTPRNTQSFTNNPDALGLVNFVTGGSIKANRELEKMNLQHLQNFELAKWNANWNKAMDDTKVRRHMFDLQEAGINPILAHGQTLSNAPTSGGASIGSSVIRSDSSASNNIGKLIKTLAFLVLKSF